MAEADRLGTELSSTWHYPHLDNWDSGYQGKQPFPFYGPDSIIIFHFSHILSQSDSKLSITID